jgi:hypothetical protein
MSKKKVCVSGNMYTMEQKEVYVYGNVYIELEADQMLEIKVLFNEDTIFKVPAKGYHKILADLVIESAKERVWEVIPEITLTGRKISTEYSVHELDDELDSE